MDKIESHIILFTQIWTSPSSLSLSLSLSHSLALSLSHGKENMRKEMGGGGLS